MGNTPASRRSAARLESLCRAASAFVPGLCAAIRVSSNLAWKDDAFAVRELSYVPLGAEGAVSSAVAQLAVLLPLGGRIARLGLVSAAAAALAGWCVYALARQLLDRVALSSRLQSVIAACAALIATLSPAFQREATHVGGAAVAASLALMLLCRQLRPNSVIGAAEAGLLLGALFVESRFAALVTIAMLLVLAVQRRLLPSRRDLAAFAAGAVLSSTLFLLPMLLTSSGATWAAMSASPAADANAIGGLQRWLLDVGVTQLAFAALGVVALVMLPATRFLGVTLLVPVALDVVVPQSASLMLRDPSAPLRLLAVGALALLAALGLGALLSFLAGARLPFSRGATALLVVLELTTVLITADDSGYELDARTDAAITVWTENAFMTLPPRSVVLVRSEAVAWRLWAAALAEGHRQDVIVVPIALLNARGLGARLVQQEPALAPLVRELIVNGRPSELALTTLADARPLFLEFDPAWDPRLTQHLLPDGLWLRFVVHDLGPSDRAAAIARGRKTMERVASVAIAADRPDRATLNILAQRTREQLAIVAALGDRGTAAALRGELERIEPGDRLALEIEGRLKRSGRRDYGLLRLLN